MEKTEELDLTQELWRRYKVKHDPNAREQLILKYSPLVKFIAGRIGANLPASVDKVDLVSYGIFGLIDAIEKFKPELEIKFETYAMSRIRGAILDEIRALDWVPRSVRSKARQLEQVYFNLENQLKRMPTDDEVARAMDMTVDDLNHTVKDIYNSNIVALDDVLAPSEKGESLTLLDTISDPSIAEPTANIEQEELAELLAETIEELPEKEKMVISLYYFEGLTLKEIGEILGVTESRICQMHTKAVLRLRGKLRELGQV